jgi:hypothetical protein
MKYPLKSCLYFVKLVIGFCTLVPSLHADVDVIDQANEFDTSNPVLLYSLLNLVTIGQEFTPATSSLDFVDLLTLPGVEGSARLQILIHRDSISGEVMGISGVLLCTNSIVAINRFLFSPGIVLTPGSNYLLQVVTLGTDFCGIGTGSDSYQAGRMVYNGLPQADKDLWFREGYRVPTMLSCPADITSDFSLEAGATVFFTVNVNEADFGVVSLNCNPPSGSTFPIGTNIVICTASNELGNAAQCSFSVIVRGPRDVVKDVLKEINTLESKLPLRDTALVHKSIALLNSSLASNLWVDETHLLHEQGRRVFLEEATAASTLRKIMRHDGNFVGNTVAQECISRLVKSNRLLATSEIEAATTKSQFQTKLSNASKHLASGDAAALQQHYPLAIIHYGKAWSLAVQ